MSALLREVALALIATREARAWRRIREAPTGRRRTRAARRWQGLREERRRLGGG